MIPLFLPFIRNEFHLTYTQSGLIFSCYTIIFSIFALLSGRFGDLHSAKKILSFGFLFTGVIFPLIFLANSYLLIMAVLALVAIGVSIFHPVGTSLLTRGWQRGIHFGIFEAGGSAGLLAMSLLSSFLITTFGWRLTAIILTLPSIPMGLAFFFSRWNFDSLDLKDSRKYNPVEAKSLFLFYFARVAHMFGAVAVVSFLPLFAVDIVGLQPEKASLFPIFLYLGGPLAVLLFAIFSDRHSPLKIIFFLLLIIIVAAFIITLSLPPFLIFFFLVIFGFCNSGSWSPQDIWLGRVSAQKIRGTAFGILISVLNLAQAVSPVFFGFLADKWGLVSAFRLTLLPLSISVICTSVLVKIENRQVQKSF